LEKQKNKNRTEQNKDEENRNPRPLWFFSLVKGFNTESQNRFFFFLEKKKKQCQEKRLGTRFSKTVSDYS
jgi:hypothetical protein